MTPGRKSKSKQPLGRFEKLGFRLGAVVVAALLRLIYASSRIEFQGLRHLDAARRTGRPIIFACWHESAMTVFIIRHGLRLPLFITMISRSRDGEIASSFSGPLGFIAVRGSSSRGAAAGMLELTRRMTTVLPNGSLPVCSYVVDGPRGPKHKSKQGVLYLARKTGAVIVPVTTGCSQRLRLRSWDRLKIPYPFARIVCRLGRPIDFLEGQAGSSPGESAPVSESEAASVSDLASSSDPALDVASAEFGPEDLDRRLGELAEGDPLCRRDELEA